MDKNRTVEIMDIPFMNISQRDFVHKEIIPSMLENKKRFIVTANPEIVMAARKDKVYKQILLEADYIVPDGIGIILAAKNKGNPLQERITGYDLMVDFLELANEKRATCFFLGGTAEVNLKTIKEVKKKYPHIQIAGSHHGYFELQDGQVLQVVKESDPDFVFVALGFPKQETWIYSNLSYFEKGIFIGVGGSFDVFSGEVKRAPNIWIKLHLEWLYRLIMQPFRWRRVLQIFYFIVLILTKKE